MPRPRGSILDIANAICSCSNRALGFVSQHRVHLPMQGLCRTANSCKPGLLFDALRIACNGLCTAARYHTAEDNPGCRLGCVEEEDCLRHYNSCPILFDHFGSLWRGTIEGISRAAIFNGLPFNNAVRSERLCIFVSGLLDGCGTAFNLRRTHRGLGLNIKELMYGRINMMTALGLAWAHTTKCAWVSPRSNSVLKPSGYPSPKKIAMLPTCRVTTRMTKIESPG